MTRRQSDDLSDRLTSIGEAVAALAAAGLDPAIGLLHADADRRPSLALDLIEEFRPLIVDQVVITATRTGRPFPDTPVACAVTCIAKPSVWPPTSNMAPHGPA